MQVTEGCQRKQQQSTCGFEELLGRAQNDIAVPVSAEKQAHKSATVSHTDPHVLVQKALQLLPRQ